MFLFSPSPAGARAGEDGAAAAGEVLPDVAAGGQLSGGGSIVERGGSANFGLQLCAELQDVAHSPRTKVH